MTDNFTNNPAAYLSELQRIEREQELAKLRTLSLEFAGVLDFFPKLREELEAFNHAEGIAFDGLSDRLRSTLEQVADLQFEIECLPDNLRNAPEMQAFVQRYKQAMSLQFVARFIAQFHGVCQDIERNAQAKAEGEKRGKAEAERRAKEQAEAARKQREREELIKTAIPEMVAIPAGTFIMGCVSGRDNVEGGCSGYEKPEHKVRVAAFSIGKCPVTFAQFDAFCELTGFAKPYDEGWGRGNRPVIRVSWDDAQQYVHWLQEMTGKPYRLPSEAEWEYAARGGNDRTAFPWGQSADIDRANYGGAIGRTTPVGQYPVNGFGLYDMHGNVWEWCQDVWHGNYQGAPSTGIVWAGGGVYRVLRGGSWLYDAQFARSAYRGSNSPVIRLNFIGFRLALGQD